MVLSIKGGRNLKSKSVFIKLILDSFFVFISFYVGYWVTAPSYNIFEFETLFVSSSIIFMSFHMYSFLKGLYRRAWEFDSIGEFSTIVKSISLAFFVVLICQELYFQDGLYRAAAIAWMISIIMTFSIRLSWRFYKNFSRKIFISSPTMNGKEMKFILEAFGSNWVAPLGENVNGFELDICNYTGAKFAVAMTTGTSAIHMALKHLGVSQGDIVFCSSLTFAASCNPVIYQNATPVFIDSEEDTWNMSPFALEKAFEKFIPKAVIVVHLYGTPAKMNEIRRICDRYQVPIIEDAAESLGATYENQQTGTLGHFGIFSFNGNKIITTSGGGMLTCKSKEEKEKIVKWITQSRDEARHYQHSELGYNYRMSNVLAGIGRGQMLTINHRIKRKTEIYNYYNDAFKDIQGIRMNPLNVDGNANHWLSCLYISSDLDVSPEHVMTTLEKNNIESRPIWKPMHLQPFYKDYEFFSHNTEGISISEDIFNNGLCLPSDVKMKEKDLKKIVEIIKSCF